MVRVNLIHPKKLADQHLIAEYNEILMLLAYVKKYPKEDNIPENYVLGKGHIKFFKNKLLYLKERHEKLKNEMKNRDFATNKTINLNEFPLNLINSWKSSKKDEIIIVSRIIEKINKKPNYYRYYGEHKPQGFFVSLLNN
jgi:deoxyribonuclease (pyrimidine dimer)